MKGIFVLVAVTALLAGHAYATSEEEMKKVAMGVREKCLAELKATADDVKELEEKHEVNSDIAKKMVLCIFKDYKIIDENNKYSKATLLEIAKKVLDGKPNQAEKMKTVEEIGEACDKEVGAVEGTPEDVAKATYECLKKNVIEKKFVEQWHL